VWPIVSIAQLLPHEPIDAEVYNYPLTDRSTIAPCEPQGYFYVHSFVPLCYCVICPRFDTFLLASRVGVQEHEMATACFP
jgi:hypothetical protein